MYLDGELYVQGNWLSDEQYSFTLPALMKGIYNVTLIVEDKRSNPAVYSVLMEVFDVTSPLLPQINSQEFIIGQNNSMIVDIIENHPSYALLMLNGSLLANLTLASSDIWLNISSYNLAIGSYNLTLYVFDQSMNNASIVFELHMENDIPYILSAIDSLSYPYGANETLTWVTYDYNPSYYEIYVDGTFSS